jgi:TPR repeat protein
MMYLNGDGIKPDRAEAFKWFSKAADAGEVTSQMNAGLMLLRGQLVNADPAKGMQWVRRAAEGGFAPAQFELALMDQRGTPPVNPAEALRMLLKAADQAYTPALTQLGYTYRIGIGVPTDPVQSLMWYRMAAEKGEPIAAYAVSVHYLSTKPADYAEGFRWTVIAAKGGHAEAQYNAGLMCEKGVGAALDLREAARWYKLAADQGSSDAQYRLGRLYVEGTGVPKDDVNGYMWLFLAKDAVSESGALLRQLQSKMPPAQIKQAEQAIDEWRIKRQSQ